MPPKLDRAQVVDTALRLLDETGLDGLTLRRIATELDVKAPALYWHFANKQALLDEMATEMLRRITASVEPPGPDADWRTWTTATCTALRRALLGHRDGAKVFSGTRLTDTGHATWQEAQLRAYTRDGFTLPGAVQAYFTAYSFTIGFVIEEQAVEPLRGERAPGYDLDARADAIGPGRPLAAASGEILFADWDRRFDTGLAVVVAGIDAVLRP